MKSQYKSNIGEVLRTFFSSIVCNTNAIVDEIQEVIEAKS